MPAEAADMALRWLELEERARMIVTEHMELVWSNAASDRLLDDSGLVEHRDGVLVAADGAAHERLSRFVQSCTEDMRMMLIRSPKDDGHLIVRGQKLADQKGVGLVGLHLLRGDGGPVGEDSPATQYAGLDEAFGLTPAEFRMVRALLDGQRADEIANNHQLSVDTVRSHIRRIYEKLNVSSREGLFRRVRPFCL